MTDIPSSIDEVTPAWVSVATGLTVTDLSIEQIGVGIGVSSAVYRLTLTGDDAPPSLVLKLKAEDEAAVFTSAVLRMYEREVKFFDEIAAQSPIRVPKGYGGAVGPDGGSYYLLMEDVGGNRVIDQLEGMSAQDAEQAVDELAGWHAAFWGQADQYVDSGAAVSISDEIYPGILPMVFEEGWTKLQAELEELHPTIADVASRWVAWLPEGLAKLATGPMTLSHGDYRGDNIFFDADGNVVLLDFQLTGVATPAFDLAYFITQSLQPEVAAAHESTLFARYVAKLTETGVPERETEGLWESYRASALFCLVYPVVASRGMDLNDPRQYALVAAMNQRSARAIEELDLQTLL